VVAPGEVTPSDGGHYRIFTPYWRAWSGRVLQPAAPTPRRLSAPADLPELRLPAIPARDGTAPSPRIARGGEGPARERLTRWLGGGLAGYEEGHDDLAGERTSRLSAFLHFGCLSPRTVLERAAGRGGLRAAALLAGLPPPGARRPAGAPVARLPPAGRSLAALEAGPAGVAGGADGLPDRRRGDAPARGRGLHAQPRAPD